ncbi:MAG TPA: DsbA family protein [Acidimicrobiales bacterium]|nr:DsbA family protein [Acidimicrobiales bacterium]
MPTSFEVNWDYLCPFARNAHEHLVVALRAGAAWDVRFRFFSLAQAHVREGEPPVWDAVATHSGVLAGLAGVVVRELHPESFWDAHLCLFSARHDSGEDLRRPEVVAAALERAGLEGARIVEEATTSWAIDLARQEHEQAVQQWEVFGVPTFIAGDKAVFVRLMTRPEGDAKLAERTVDRVLDLIDEFPELNEFKYTRVER